MNYANQITTQTAELQFTQRSAPYYGSVFNSSLYTVRKMENVLVIFCLEDIIN